MKIDTEMNISGVAAIEFAGLMTNVDKEAIIQRDSFISGIETERDENGSLIIDCPNLSIDFVDEVIKQDAHMYFTKKTTDMYWTSKISVDRSDNCVAVLRLKCEEDIVSNIGYTVTKKTMYSVKSEDTLPLAS